MFAYIVRRLLLIIPTLVIILLVNFVIVQAAPGGPVEQAIAHLQGIGGGGVGGSSGEGISGGSRASRGLDPKLIADIEKQYGFDKPAPERLWLMLKSYAQLDFGNSFFRGKTVIDLILEKMPVTISLGLTGTAGPPHATFPPCPCPSPLLGRVHSLWGSELSLRGSAQASCSPGWEGGRGREKAGRPSVTTHHARAG